MHFHTKEIRFQQMKPRNDLFVYKTTELESTVIVLIQTNIIISAIYGHPNMELDEFNESYFNLLLDNI